MDIQFVTCYQNNRALIQRFVPELLAELPEECPSVGEMDESIGSMERMEFSGEGAYTSRHPKYSVVVGMENGAWVLEYFRIHENTLRALHIVEPDTRVFIRQLMRFSWSLLLQDRRVHWHIGSAAEGIQAAMAREIPEIASWGIHGWRYGSQVVPDSEPNTRFLEMVKNALRVADDNARIQIERGLIMQSNILQNLPKMVHSMNLGAVANRFTHVPAVVIGAGPSLNLNIEALRDAAPGVLLIATDTSLRPLIQHGIQPHIVITCDPLQLNHRHFEGIDSLGDAILAYLPEANARILDQYACHPRLLCLHDLQSKLLQRLAAPLGIHKTFRRRMNVGYCGFIMALEMGCSPIILVGMDLAVTPGGWSHAAGTANVSTVILSEDGKRAELHGKVEAQAAGLVPIEGYNGGGTFTFTYFYQILRSLEQMILSNSTPVIDATEGGAKKRGAIQMSLQDALAAHRGAGDLVPRFQAVTQESIDALSKNRQSIPYILEVLEDIQRALGMVHGQLRMGWQRLSQWEPDGKEGACFEVVEKQSRWFLSRWTELLESEAVDVGIDIGLARWRYATQRTESPEGLSGAELKSWWSGRFREWLEGFGQDLVLFDQLFLHAKQSLQTGLTSCQEKQ